MTRRPAKSRTSTRKPANLAGHAHAQRASDQVAAAVAEVDAWYVSDEDSKSLDLSDSCVAAVEAASARAAELGVTVTRPAGRRVILSLQR